MQGGMEEGRVGERERGEGKTLPFPLMNRCPPLH